MSTIQSNLRMHFHSEDVLGLHIKIFARSFWLCNSFVIRNSSIHENVICKILFAKLNRLVYMRVYVPYMNILVLLAYKYS